MSDFLYRQKYRQDANETFIELYKQLLGEETNYNIMLVLDALRVELVYLANRDVLNGIPKRDYIEALEEIKQTSVSYDHIKRLIEQLKNKNDSISDNLYEHYEQTYDKQVLLKQEPGDDLCPNYQK